LSSVINVLNAGTFPSFKPDDLGIGPMPAPPGNGGLLVGGAALWIVKGKSDAETAATWDYVKYLTSPAAQAEWAAGTGYVPIRKSSLDQEPIKSLYASDPRYAVAFQQLISGAITPATAGPVLGPQGEVRQATSEAMQAIFGGADVKASLDTRRPEGRRQIARLRQTHRHELRRPPHCAFALVERRGRRQTSVKRARLWAAVDRVAAMPHPFPAADGSSPQTRQFSSEPEMGIDPSKRYTATMETNLGTIVIALDPAAAPKTVNNFVFLANYHYFDGVIFHRIIKGFVCQGGDPTGTAGVARLSLRGRAPEAGRYEIGSLAMANAGANTNGSQFFIISGPDGARLPPQYSLFGKVVKGLDVVENMQSVKTGAGDKPVEDVVINSVTISEAD
jgi:cyclophilin family peptidyl-prolyl cis-trans isomerase